MSTVSKDDIATLPRGTTPGDRWAVLTKTSPSGKTLFRCMCCGHESPAPQKVCWKTTVKPGETSSVREPNVECMTWMPVRLMRYYLPSEKSEGWALIVIGSDGYFSAVSDYGNYSFLWTHHGCEDFRQFLLRADQSWDYFASKLSHGMVYDGHATYEAVKKHILESRRARDMDKDFARREWDRLHDNDRLDTTLDYSRWADSTEIDDCWEFHVEDWPSDVKAFCKKTLKRLAEVLRQDLIREGKLISTTTRVPHGDVVVSKSKT